MALGPAPITPEGYVEAYNRNLLPMERNIFQDGPREYDQIAKVGSTDRLTNEMQTVQGLALPTLNRDGEAIPQVSPVKGYKSVIRILGYRSQVTVEKTAIETMVFEAPLDNARDMMRATVTLKDQVSVDFFNNGFTDSLSTNITEFDGTARAAFSTGHRYENGNGTWSNWYNVGVPPNPETVYLLINQYLRRLKDYAAVNFVSYGNEFVIVTPTSNPAYGMAADEIIQSVDRPDTANRATNVLKSVRLRHVALNQLTSSSTWFLIVPTSTAGFPLRLLNRIDYEVNPLAPVGNINRRLYVTDCCTHFGAGWDKHYRGITGVKA